MTLPPFLHRPAPRDPDCTPPPAPAVPAPAPPCPGCGGDGGRLAPIVPRTLLTPSLRWEGCKECGGCGTAAAGEGVT